MKTKTALLTSILLAAAVIAAAPARSQQNGSHVDGTITAAFDPTLSPPAWAGYAFLSIGQGPIQVFRFVDVNTGGKAHPNHFNAKGSGNFNGFERMTLAAIDGTGGFELDLKFVAVCSSVYSCTLNETGEFVPEAGTGPFAGMKGAVAIHGPFAGGATCLDQPCIFIGQLSGSIGTK